MMIKKVAAIVVVMAAGYGTIQPSIAEAEGECQNPKRSSKPNIIVILADDVGKDASNLYNAKTEEEEFPETAPTPSLATLADQGILFTNGWAMPACSITRGTRTMGLLPSSSGMGDVLGGQTRTPHSSDESTVYPPIMVDPNNPDLIQAIARDAGYRTYKLGKWHETNGTDMEVIQDVLDSGFDKYYGQNGGYPDPYRGNYGGDQEWTPDNSIGEPPTYEFMTSALVTHAIQFIEEPNDKPYYLALDFAAAHWVYDVAPGPDEPPPLDNPDMDWRTLDPEIHADVIAQVKAAFAADFAGDYPPAGTSSYPTGYDPFAEAKRRAAFKSLIAYMDVQIGRLLEHVDLNNTYIIFVGDNGTQGSNSGASTFDVVEAPEDPYESKLTLFHNGVEVPFLVAGPHIRNMGRTSDALVTTTDIYATVLDLIGQRQPKQTRSDSISFAGLLSTHHDELHRRRYNVAEQFVDTPAAGGYTVFGGIHGRVVSDGRYRLITRARVETQSVVAEIDGVSYDIAYPAFVCIPDNPTIPSYSPDCTADDPIGFSLQTNPYTGQSVAYPSLNPDYDFFQTEINGSLDLALAFYDTESDPAENNNLLESPADMSLKQKAAFLRHCATMNRVSRNANYYFTERKTCVPPKGMFRTEEAPEEVESESESTL